MKKTTGGRFLHPSHHDSIQSAPETHNHLSQHSQAVYTVYIEACSERVFQIQDESSTLLRYSACNFYEASHAC